MPPITDPRQLAAVLADWMARHGLTSYRYGLTRPLDVSRQTINNWLRGAPCHTERQVRALMTLIDEGRA